MSARGFIGSGDLYIAKYNAATASFDPPSGPYECDKFEISPKSEIKELSSKGRTTYGQVIESVPLNQPAEFSISLPEVNKETLVLALLGTQASTSQGSGTVTDEAVVAHLDKWTQLAHQNIAAAGLVVTNSTAATTYALDIDYTVDYALGMIKPLAGGAITEAQALKVDYTYNAISATTISGATNAQLRAQFILNGKNMADDLPCIVRVHEAVLAASSAFDFLSDNFAKLELKGKLKTPTGKSEPFTVEMRATA